MMAGREVIRAVAVGAGMCVAGVAWGNSHGEWVVAELVDGRTLVFNMQTGEIEGGEELAKAFGVGKREAMEAARGYLRERGWDAEGVRPLAQGAHGEFQYRVVYALRDERTTVGLVFDRRTGEVGVEYEAKGRNDQIH